MATILSGTGITFSDGSVTTTSSIPTGSYMLFQQTTAPTGWTKQTTHNDKALRVVSGAASFGGSTAFTSVFTSRTPSGTVANTTLTTAQIPSHSHTTGTYVNQSNGGAPFQGGITFDGNGSFPISVGSSGGGGSHNHGFTGTAMDFAVQYVDLIIASKN